MDLFVDKYYELECENQINYYNILYSESEDIPEGYTVIDSLSVIYSDIKYIIAEGTGHIQNNTSKLYCHEVQLTSNIKKIILELE